MSPFIYEAIIPGATRPFDRNEDNSFVSGIIAEIGGVRVKEPTPSERKRPSLPFIKRAFLNTAELESFGWAPLPGSVRDKLKHSIAELHEEQLLR